MSQRKSLKDNVVEYANRYFKGRVQKLIGYPVDNELNTPIYDGYHLIMCPFSKEIQRFSKSSGKLERMLVPCGRCLYCLHKKQNQLIYRLCQHNKLYNNAVFVTLTYNNEHYTEDIDLLRRDITLFIKRFRKELNDKTFSYYLVCERGTLRNRCHFHMLIWWNGCATKSFVTALVSKHWVSGLRTLTDIKQLLDWNKLTSSGFVYVDGEVNNSVASYVSKYVTDIDKKQLFRSWSKGLGKDILSLDEVTSSQLRNHLVISYLPKDKSYTIPVPRYYKQKTLTQSERDAQFLDYITSEDTKQKWDLFHDPERYLRLLDVYKNYEIRVRNSIELNKQRKMSKNKLL